MSTEFYTRREALKRAGKMVLGVTALTLIPTLEGCGNVIEATVANLKDAESRVQTDIDVNFADVVVETYILRNNLVSYKIYDPGKTTESDPFYMGIDTSHGYFGHTYRIPNPGLPGNRQEGKLNGRLTQATEFPEYKGLELPFHFIRIRGFTTKLTGFKQE